MAIRTVAAAVAEAGLVAHQNLVRAEGVSRLRLGWAWVVPFRANERRSKQRKQPQHGDHAHKDYAAHHIWRTFRG